MVVKCDECPDTENPYAMGTNSGITLCLNLITGSVWSKGLDQRLYSQGVL